MPGDPVTGRPHNMVSSPPGAQSISQSKYDKKSIVHLTWGGEKEQF